MKLLAEDFEFVDALHEARVLALESCVAALPENSRNLLDKRYRDANSLQQVAVSQETTPNALYKTYSGSGRDCGSVSTSRSRRGVMSDLSSGRSGPDGRRFLADEAEFAELEGLMEEDRESRILYLKTQQIHQDLESQRGVGR